MIDPNSLLIIISKIKLPRFTGGVMSTSFELQAPKFGHMYMLLRRVKFVSRGFISWALNLMALLVFEKGRA